MAHGQGNRETGEFTLEIDGKAYRFKLGMLGSIALQEHFSDSDAVARMHAEAEVKRLRAALSVYGQHVKDCKQRPCTCGFTVATMPTPLPKVVPVGEILTQVYSGRMQYIAAFVWAGLRRSHPELTLDQTMDLLDAASPDEVQKLLAVLGLSTQPDEADVKELSEGVSKKKNPRKARAMRGTGETSISRPATSA